MSVYTFDYGSKLLKLSKRRINKDGSDVYPVGEAMNSSKENNTMFVNLHSYDPLEMG